MDMVRRTFSLPIVFCAMALAMAVTFCKPVLAAERECRIVIIKSRDLAQYNTALEGFSEAIAKRPIKCETVTYNLKGQADRCEEIIEKTRTFKPDLILTVGSRATDVISENFQNTPVVFSMVLYPVASAFVSSMDKPGKNLTGAAMDVPTRLQLQTFSKIVPKLKRVGVLYSPEETLPVIEEAKRTAKSMNIQLLAEQVNSESDVPDALSRLEKEKMDALWSVADSKVFTMPSTRYIIEQVVRRGIPFMGPHIGYVKAGALVALAADYRDNGRQAGEIAGRILGGGAKPGSIAVATPRVVEVALNLHVANHIGLEIPQRVIDDLRKTFKKVHIIK